MVEIASDEERSFPGGVATVVSAMREQQALFLSKLDHRFATLQDIMVRLQLTLEAFSDAVPMTASPPADGLSNHKQMSETGMSDGGMRDRPVPRPQHSNRTVG